MATREELVGAIRDRYSGAPRLEKVRILDEFVAVTGFHRKHAMRLLREVKEPSRGPRPERRLYGDAARQALIVLWEAADRICAMVGFATFKPYIPDREFFWHWARESSMTFPIGKGSSS
jgi:hypothetical protein